MTFLRSFTFVIFAAQEAMLGVPEGSFQVLGDVVEDCHSYGCFFTFQSTVNNNNNKICRYYMSSKIIQKYEYSIYEYLYE